MSFEIIEGRNGGYPCIPQLSERSSTGLTPPCCQYMMQVSVEGKYPAVQDVPEITSIMTNPFPENMMSCYGPEVNSGYPWLALLETIVQATFSRLRTNGRTASALWYNGQEIKKAYSKEQKVYEIYYLKRRIV